MISYGSMSASRSGTRSTARSIPTPPAEAISAEDEVRPAAPRSWSGDEQLSIEQLQAALHQLLLLERVTDLDGGPLLLALGELRGGEHRGAADPVAAGGGARAARATLPGPAAAERTIRSARARPTHIALTRQFCSYGRLEVDLAAHRRDPDRVAVVADAGDHPVEEVAGALGGELAEAQRVENRDRPRPQREDVAQDAADSGRRPLEGLTALGWLCDSTLKAIACPSPTSTAPAFSPGPISTRGPSVGRRRSSFRECL